MATEEQAEELEVLASIFVDEYEVLDDAEGLPCFKITLKPSSDESENHGMLEKLLIVTFKSRSYD